MSNPALYFKKGQSGNPNGRPKKAWTMAGIYRKELEKTVISKDGKKIEAKKAVGKRLIQLALEGDIVAIKEIGNRIDGLPQESIKHSGSIESPQPLLGGQAKDSV